MRTGWTESESELSANQKAHYKALIKRKKWRPQRKNWQRLWGSSCSLWQVLQRLQRQKQKKRLAWEDVAKQIKLQTGMYCSSEYSFICLVFSLVRIMLLYGCSFLGFFRLAINYRSIFLVIVSAERLPEKTKIATFGGMRDGTYSESEAYDSASVVPIHTRSELSSDSDSVCDCASVASVNQPLWLFYSSIPLCMRDIGLAWHDHRAD